jgi:hypothetical protein
VAGRINKKVTRSSSQWNATAAAAARSVAITSVANCSAAIMTRPPLLRYCVSHSHDQSQDIDNA